MATAISIVASAVAFLALYAAVSLPVMHTLQRL
jgi:hypothetical protein